MAFDFANNPMFSPANLLTLSGNILAGPNFASGLGTGLQQLGTNVAAQQKEQNERQRQMQEQTQAANYLRQQNPGVDLSNYTPGMINAATNSAMERQFNPGSGIISVGNGLLYDKNTKQFMQPPAEMLSAQDDGWGLNPTWVQDPATKKMRLMISNKRGETKFLDTQGTDPVSPLKAIDTGTGTMLVDPRSAQEVSTVPKDIEGAEDQKLSAKNKADARGELATVKTMAQQVDEAVKDLIGDEEAGTKPDPGLARVVGAFDGGWGSWSPNFTAAANRAQTKIDYLKGTAFVQGRKFLQGQGQITDFESKKAEAAFSRMNQAQSEADFIQAVKDFNDAVQAGVAKVEAAANGNWQGADSTTPETIANPTADDLVNKYRSKPR